MAVLDDLMIDNDELDNILAGKYFSLDLDN